MGTEAQRLLIQETTGNNVRLPFEDNGEIKIIKVSMSDEKRINQRAPLSYDHLESDSRVET